MNKNNIYIIGDIHGEFKTVLYLLLNRYKVENCHIIVAGDIGLGFYKINYYTAIFNEINEDLKTKDIHIYFIRGNHDNPDWFDNTPNELSAYSNIHIIKDYSVLNINNHHILCIGGAVSPDKIERILGQTWWEGEEVKRIDNLDEVIKENNIDIVVSHTNPIFTEPKLILGNKMSVSDFELSKECGKILAEVFFYLIEHNNPLKYWIHGHHHRHIETFVPNEYNDMDMQYLKAGLTIEHNSYNEGPIKIVCLDQCYKNNIDLLKIKL